MKIAPAISHRDRGGDTVSAHPAPTGFASSRVIVPRRGDFVKSNSKKERASALLRALHRLGPMPCGCIPRLKNCSCEALAEVDVSIFISHLISSRDAAAEDLRSPTCKCAFEVEICHLEECWYRFSPLLVKRHAKDGTDVRFDHLRPRSEMTPVAAEHWDAWAEAGIDEIDEQYRQIEAMIDLYADNDATNYSGLIADPTPRADHLRIVSRKRRLDLMEARVAAGFSPFHPDDACNQQIKVGEQLGRNRNGSINYRGVG